jgi:hypothetical protein
LSENQKTSLPKAKKHFNIDRILAIAALATIVIAWFAGSERAESDLFPAVEQVIPGAGTIERVNDELYAAYQGESKSELLG